MSEIAEKEKSADVAAWYASIKNHRFPRYSDLPDIDLYIDQLVSILDKNLSVLYLSDGKICETPITASMINNYVKHEAVPRPKRKRYGKDHYAYLFIICALKQVYSINEIGDFMSHNLKTRSVGELYDKFCEETEKAIAVINELISGEIPVADAKSSEKDFVTVKMAIFTVIMKLFVKKSTQNLQKK
ncbi:MAG: DUF1836 domain-containing protein [Oscillospiraceae bacterium]|nr:DUF1836 domain-containing protein [Oscillospiraceae bacterium]